MSASAPAPSATGSAATRSPRTSRARIDYVFESHPLTERRSRLADVPTTELIQELARRAHESFCPAAAAPLARDGIRQLEIRTGNEQSPTVTITGNDLPAIIEAIEDDERRVITDQRYDQVLTVTAPNFQPNLKWRLGDGSGTDWFAMRDQTFLARVDTGEIGFRKGDRIRANVRLLQWEDAAGDMHTEHEIVRVAEYMPARPGIQMSLLDPAE